MKLATERVLEADGIKVRIETVEMLETEETITKALRLDGVILNDGVKNEKIRELSLEKSG